MKKIAIHLGLLIVLFTFFVKQVKAANPLDSIRVNPADFRSIKVGDVIHMSALGFDQYGSALHYGITYQWGISSGSSIGQIRADNTGKIAVLKVVGEGQGDLYVTASDGINQVTKSFQIDTGDNPEVCDADIDQSGIVNIADYTVLAANFMKRPPIDIRADINSSGLVDLSDYTLLVNSFFEECKW